MDILIPGLFVLAGLSVLLVCILVIVLLSTTKRLVDTNRQLLIFIAGREKNTGGLGALVASEKPPQGKLVGIANKTLARKKDADKLKNTDYTMEIGLPKQ